MNENIQQVTEPVEVYDFEYTPQDQAEIKKILTRHALRKHIPAMAVNLALGVLLIFTVIEYAIPPMVFLLWTSIALFNTLKGYHKPSMLDKSCHYEISSQKFVMSDRDREGNENKYTVSREQIFHHIDTNGWYLIYTKINRTFLLQKSKLASDSTLPLLLKSANIKPHQTETLHTIYVLLVQICISLPLLPWAINDITYQGTLQLWLFAVSASLALALVCLIGELIISIILAKRCVIPKRYILFSILYIGLALWMNFNLIEALFSGFAYLY